jgi:hypothetical protein
VRSVATGGKIQEICEWLCRELAPHVIGLTIEERQHAGRGGSFALLLCVVSWNALIFGAGGTLGISLLYLGGVIAVRRSRLTVILVIKAVPALLLVLDM